MKPKHPGKTPAQRRVLDQIGCGNYSPIMTRATEAALLRRGLIERLSDRIEPFGNFRMIIKVFQMPIRVHMQWCSAVAATDDEMAAMDDEAPSIP